MDTEELLTHLREKWEHSGYAPWKDDAFDLLRAAERLRDELAEARKVGADLLEQRGKLQGENLRFSRRLIAAGRENARLRKQIRMAHDDLTWRAAPMNWATDGMLSTALRHNAEWIRRIEAERDQLHDELEVEGAKAASRTAIWENMVRRTQAAEKERERLRVVVEKVRTYADDRAFHARGHLNTVNSGRIASDLFTILEPVLGEGSES